MTSEADRGSLYQGRRCFLPLPSNLIVSHPKVSQAIAMSEPEDRNPFDGPQMQGIHYRQANMTGANFDGVNLEGAQFYAVMTSARFTDTNLNAATFRDVSLANAQFDDVNLSGAVISNANLSRLTITGVTFAHSDIQDADLTGMRINGVLVSELFDAYERVNP